MCVYKYIVYLYNMYLYILYAHYNIDFGIVTLG